MTSNQSILGGGLRVDLGALARNWRALDTIAGKALAAAVVKADAYGMGLETVSKTLFHAGARFFFVATPDEGLALRKAVVDAHIFVLDGLVPKAADVYASHHLMPVLASMEQVAAWIEFCLEHQQAYPAALHFDTGMNRLGLRPQEVEPVKELLERSGFQPQMVMSHFACADQPKHEKNRMQLAFFRSILNHFPNIPASLANSAGLMTSKSYHFQLVRPGVATYGGRAVSGRANPMAPVMHLDAPILQIKEARMDETVGYGATFTLRRDSRIAILGLGYGDGLLRALSRADGQHEGGVAAVNGQVVPMIGRVSMDLLAIDITDVDGPVAPGDLVEIVGQTISVDTQADAAGTIGYEILTTLNGRFPRTYVNAPDDLELN